MDRLRIEVGGVAVHARLDAELEAARAGDRYRPFLSERRPGCRLDIRKAQSRLHGSWQPRVLGRERLIASASSFNWDIRLRPSGALGSAVLGARRSTFCAWGGAPGRTCAEGRGLIQDKAQALDSALRALYSSLLNRAQGALLHAAAVVRRKGAYLLPGVSGAGKTTLMRTLRAEPELDCLSDELVALRRFGKEIRAYSTPFWGEFRIPENNGCAPVRSLLFLARGRRLERVPLSAAEAMRRLLRCLVLFETSREAAGRAMDLLAAAAWNLPAYELRWRPGHPAAEILRMIA
ncbi:MAG: hypothetical protein HY922_08530 [Elusimicrobia bacterium]|nr:hypothetical protein [Elusimicrobiota bacterium]